MYPFPRLQVNLPHLRENIRIVKGLCAERGIEIMAVTKVFRGAPEIARVFVEEGLTMLGDSRVGNLARMEQLPAEKWLIRPPMLSEVEGLVRYADGALQSSRRVLQAVQEEILRQQCPAHKVILMADLGDLREGYTDYEEMLEVALYCQQQPGLNLYGIGTNLTCFSFVQPDQEKMQLLVDLARRMEEVCGRPLALVSGGNSATIDLMLRGGIPAGVNNLRLGESLLFGKERAKYRFLPGTHQDVFVLDAEIVELKEKPSLPWGEIGLDSYGNRPSFVDRGLRLRAVCALGKQDFDPETSQPLDPGISMLGASSDHLMLDVTDSETRYQVGDTVRLQLGYFSTMRAYTSDYVQKVYLS